MYPKGPIIRRDRVPSAPWSWDFPCSAFSSRSPAQAPWCWMPSERLQRTLCAVRSEMGWNKSSLRDVSIPGASWKGVRGSECPGWMCAQVHQPYGLRSPLCSSQPPKSPSWDVSPLPSPLSSALPGWGRGTKSVGPPVWHDVHPCAPFFLGVPFLWPCCRNLLPELPVSSWWSSKKQKSCG